MARSPFSLFKRTPTLRSPYYIQFWDRASRRYATARSAVKLSEILGLDPEVFPPHLKPGARGIAIAWLDSGNAFEKEEVLTLGAYCLKFWDWDTSEYIKSKKLRNERIGMSYVRTSHSYIERHLLPHALSSVPLHEVTTGQLESFEPPRDCRRLKSLRGYSHGKGKQVFARGSGEGSQARNRAA